MARPGSSNAEDLKLLDQKGMEQSFQYQDLQNQYPQSRRVARRPRRNHLAQHPTRPE